MKLLLLQYDIAWGDAETNLRRIEGMVAGALGGEGSASSGDSGFDLIVLPEMFATGYATDPEGLADPDGGAKTLAWMRDLARKTDSAVVGSAAVSEEERFYNRMFFVRPDGSHGVYDKRHLFSFAGEDRKYTAGSERVVVEWRGVRILLQVCYDLRFPVFARNRNDYDLAIYSANWPTSRIDAWRSLLKARAIENLCYIAAANRTGDDPSGGYSGGTYLVDYRGRTIGDAGEEEKAVVAEMDMESLRAFRRKFPALSDADHFEMPGVGRT